MWSPTHIQVTVQRAKNLLTKGKNGTNNCFVTIGVGKEKYQTSVKEKSEPNVNWNEECELKIPDQGNRAELVLTCLHRNNIGIDEFLGQVTLPLNEMDVYDRPRSKWFKLESKPGKEKKNKERGELEVRISFIVKSGSLTDLSKKEKHKSSIGQLASSVGGSLLSIGTIEKRKGIKKFAKSLGSKMHLHSKKKNKDGDDNSSYSGSFASIGTPNSSQGGGSRRYGQRAGEADPGVISEDEDEFVFDNLSHKSSGSSLNIRSAPPPLHQNFVPHNPSPLLGLNGKAGGKQLSEEMKVEKTLHEQAVVNNVNDIVIDPELEQIENNLSVRTRNMPPPSKPPRTPQLSNMVFNNANNNDNNNDNSNNYSNNDNNSNNHNNNNSNTMNKNAKSVEQRQPNEWESKLYGNNLDVNTSSETLKRRSWELARVPLPTTNEEKEPIKLDITKEIDVNSNNTKDTSSSSSSSSSEEEPDHVEEPTKESETKTKTSSPIIKQSDSKNRGILSPDTVNKDFNNFNAIFAKFEQRNSSIIFDSSLDDNVNSQKFIANERQVTPPKPSPRARVVETKTLDEEEDALKNMKTKESEEEAAALAAAIAAKEEQERAIAAAEAERKVEEERQRRAEEDARLEADLRLNEQRLRDEELALEEELRQRREDEQKRRDAKRLEEDQRILNFMKQTSVNDESANTLKINNQNNTPEPSPKEPLNEHREKRLGKFKYKRGGDKQDCENNSPKSNERIIIGHEKSVSHAERRSEITAALSKKYEGKSREELMLIANGMENEALVQRQRVKELEDYLDNLLLRVMETHPKILQNPYSRTTSAKSG